ncbi:hypothetical protein FQR65_LT03652 [Abscondita terminalis]|nr:hypothetical protein FQR65_LT03652 [Abscondita terminalis]
MVKTVSCLYKHQFEKLFSHNFKENSVRLIKINRPRVKNAFNEEVFTTITNILNSDAGSDAIAFTILTGTGNVFSSVIELQPNKIINVDAIKHFINALINHPKLIIAVVNGPAIGIAASILPLCDIVFGSSRATFVTPFIKHGFIPEACSSHLFPRTMERSKAMEMLLLGETFTARDALNANLISKIIPHDELDEHLENLLSLDSFSVDWTKTIKRLFNDSMKDKLEKFNDNEMTLVKNKLNSGSYLQAVQKYQLKKHKL